MLKHMDQYSGIFRNSVMGPKCGCGNEGPQEVAKGRAPVGVWWQKPPETENQHVKSSDNHAYANLSV